jgi:hypothetical protein
MTHPPPTKARTKSDSVVAAALIYIAVAAPFGTAAQLEVLPLSDARPVSFRRQVIAVLTQAGCNAGACHGTPSGKNGFRLSLRGYLPDVDYDNLTHDMHGRRVNSLDADRSLILLKATGQVPHEGGKRFDVGSSQYKILRDWIAAGRPSDLETAPRLVRLELLPARAVVNEPERTQQIRVVGHFVDGSTGDVTSLACFSSSDVETADVSPAGAVASRKMGEAAILVRYLDATATSRLTFLKDVPGFVWPDLPESNYVDRHVFAKLRLLRLPPSDLTTDEEFLRRAFLDVCGILPTPDEARAFLADKSPDKRAKLIDVLPERPEYADFGSLKWADKLGCNNRFVGAAGAYKYRRWIREAIATNRPFDEWVREILTATGPNYSQPASGFYRRIRDPDSRVETVAQLFLGVRVQCARCHNHPAERWTQDDYFGLAAFFPRIKYKDSDNFIGIYNKEEVVYVDRAGEVTHPRTGQTVAPKYLGGAAAAANDTDDRRQVLAEWLTSRDNPFFARTAVNRIWFHMFGRGIVEPVDDFRDSNPPSNDELLDALAADFAARGFDTKHVIRTIMNSRTYQFSSRPNELNAADVKYFSHAQLRLLTAEQLLDAISQVTGSSEKFAGLPLGTRAAELPDGEFYHRFLRTFGQPQRSSACECERESDSTLTQALHLIGGRVVHNKLRADDGRVQRLASSNMLPNEVLDELYLAALSRFPNSDERQVGLNHLESATERRAAVEDLTWALINSKEFLFQH